ncbi:GNAT family N-acetyltransferase [Albimonas pacifica]|uniref:Protein N-acetyltransferase, RimJ/RimL family n=1 Tax=Albimonas pacifica TaxID=1114924 RepID=A0A1I3N1S4_9RHOB|nr:GNAT family N-acetyltransferase [Albimonas pacifica]SFJ03122.1 Protein N-acetyltransferase, RimJ/RimL family [Albimonas pacifica]
MTLAFDLPLDTPRLRLRAPAAADAPALDAIFSDPLAMARAGGPRPTGFGEVWAAEQRARLAAGEPAALAIERRGRTGLAGVAGLAPGASPDAPRLALLLAPAQRGEGLGAEAAAAVLIAAFARPAVPRSPVTRRPLSRPPDPDDAPARIEALAAPGDAALIRTLERVGLRYVRLDLPAGGQVYALHRP